MSKTSIPNAPLPFDELAEAIKGRRSVYGLISGLRLDRAAPGEAWSSLPYRPVFVGDTAESAVFIGRRVGRLPRNLLVDSVVSIHGRHLSPPRSRSDIYSQSSLIGMRPRSFLIYGVCEDCQPHPTSDLPGEGTSPGA